MLAIALYGSIFAVVIYPSSAARTTGVSNPFHPPSFHLLVSVSAQQCAFAFGVLLSGVEPQDSDVSHLDDHIVHFFLLQSMISYKRNLSILGLFAPGYSFCILLDMLQAYSTWVSSPAAASMFSAGQFSAQKGFLSDMSDNEMKPSELVDTKENFVTKSQSQMNLKASPSLLSSSFERIPGDLKTSINGKQMLQEDKVSLNLRRVRIRSVVAYGLMNHWVMYRLVLTCLF